MTDPRIPALAEALDAARCLTIADEYGYAAAADAILAALPPDWCGHGAFMDTAALRAEIARLRRIEEAARALFDEFYGPIETWDVDGSRSMIQLDHGHEEYEARIALRAALEEKP